MKRPRDETPPARAAISAVGNSSKCRGTGESLRPGGRLVVFDCDWKTLTFVVYTQANRVLMFSAIVKNAIAEGLAAAAAAERWLWDLEESHAVGRFFAALTGFCVNGRKPIASAEPGSIEERP